MHLNIQDLLNQFTSSLNNQFLSGGLILGIIGGVIAYAKSLPSITWKWFLRLFSVNISVSSNDQAFHEILLWLDDQKYTRKTRRMAIKHINGVMTIVPSKGMHWFWWDKRLVWFSWHDDEGKMGGIQSYIQETRETLNIRILGRSRLPVNRILNEAKDRLKVKTDGKCMVYRRRDYGWVSQTKEKRPLSTVFLPNDALDLIDDINKFLSSKNWHRTVGVPFRRGYLFHGPPGNGKSSVALAVASELDMPLYVLNLSLMAGDGELENAISNVPTAKAVVLLIEDIDTVVPGRKGDRTKDRFNLGTLLNCMDGVLSKENIVLIATTNHKEKLDPALVRPGRIDKLIEFHKPSVRQIEQAIQLFFKDEPIQLEARIRIYSENPKSMAQVQEILVRLAAEKGVC